MDNQHRKIQTYRELSQAEIDAMNSVKALEADIAALHAQIAAMPGVDKRDLAMSRTHFEDACIRLVRSVARPVTPWA
ncbi:NAD/FAD-utilizing enzyme [Pseudomonas phage MR6]|uniref:NAD/FAD-utilizing enzyme n=1 Tax=Pseudomonas phage MR5 TaxID=2711172 RepID=A0A6M3TCS3_9CAUD|nr:NAD/FAD-utilizing enzyme [Pseudomonas phage MR5]QJD54884.1 NAD/FAD-utilizing enzyme [Pseudomonas phage MR6]QJD54945.1 NAD/FAD-utilizing enzyme [Pseudomonas phage MR7]